MPPTCEVPRFAPLRVRGGRLRVRGVLRRGRHRRTVAAGLAMAAAALAAAGPHGFAGPGRTEAEADAAAGGRGRAAATELVRTPVRIADAETVRLLRPGDRVDVIAAPTSGADAVRVAAGVRVASVSADSSPEEAGAAREGALVVLVVPRADAAKLASAGFNSRLAVVLC